MKLFIRLKSKYWRELQDVLQAITSLADKQGLRWIEHRLPSQRIGTMTISEKIRKVLKLKIRELEILNPEQRFARELINISKAHPKVSIEVYYE